MRALSSKTKTIDIQLDRETFYFPGDTIQGVIHVHPKSATKTNSIRLKFVGEIILEKEMITLFQLSKTIDLGEPEAKASYVVLEPKAHAFSFQWRVPNDMQLPSTMEFNKKLKVRYTISVVHHKYHVPESLCPQASYPVQILDMINVEDSQYRKPFDQTFPIMVQASSAIGRPCTARVSLPRSGFTRGDVIPVSTIITHVQPFGMTSAFRAELVRTIKIRQNKSVQKKQDVIKTLTDDININNDANLSQTLTQQLMIPSSVPPSLAFGDEELEIQYKVRLQLQLQHRSILFGKANDQKDEGTLTIDIPITVGTWPRAVVPIDDDDEDDDVPPPPPLPESERGELDDDDGSWAANDSSVIHSPYPDDSSSAKGESLSRNSSISNDPFRRPMDPLPLQQQQQQQQQQPMQQLTPASTPSSTSTVRLTPTPRSSSISPGVAASTQMTNGTQGDMGRSDSLASRSSDRSIQSMSSWHSNQSWNSSSPSMSRTMAMPGNDLWRSPSQGMPGHPQMPLSPTMSTMSSQTDSTILLTPATSDAPSILRPRNSFHEADATILLSPTSPQAPGNPLQKRNSMINLGTPATPSPNQDSQHAILLQPTSRAPPAAPFVPATPPSPHLSTPPTPPTKAPAPPPKQTAYTRPPPSAAVQPPPPMAANDSENDDDDDDDSSDDDGDFLSAMRKAEQRKQPALASTGC
ncbi:hypothetical protein BC940DRAFT_306422 [Gongronella butleri]|nr:hypothetical protein BC940DRAFT_306422 [Gongronella butleri]